VEFGKENRYEEKFQEAFRPVTRKKAAKSVRNPKYEKTRTTPFWYKPFRNYERFSGTCSKKTLIS